VFADVALSSRIFAKEVQVRWEIEADDGFELGGWTLDDVCIVANVNSVCGDGRLSGAEQCDDGASNADVADTCRTTCRIPRCGDGIIDELEVCDDGNDDDGDTCDATCQPVEIDPGDRGGCCSTSSDPRAPLLPLGAVALLLLYRRRRGPGS
jgi:MYXO-CTERM domain-containing protein